MIRSMTGYGRARIAFDSMEMTCEIKSVNHRYFELSTRLPRSCFSLEDAIRNELKKRIVRGKIELNFQIVSTGEETVAVSVDDLLLKHYLKIIRAAAAENGLPDDLSASTVLRLNNVLTSRDFEPDEAFTAHVLETVNAALDVFLAQREAEGERLKEDILGKCDTLTAMSLDVEARVPELISAYETRLHARITELLGDRTVDEGRLLTEVGVFADKIAVDEELVRLRSHITGLSDLLSSDGDGKKMDFTIQEMNREVNTMTSKIGDLDVTRKAIEMKSLIEKIREQIQNIE